MFDKECLLLFVASDWLASPEDFTCRSRLLSVVLVRYCQLLAAMCAARSQYATTILSCHTLTETMLVYATTIVRLILRCLVVNGDTEWSTDGILTAVTLTDGILIAHG